MKKLIIPITLILFTLITSACSSENDQSFAIYISEESQLTNFNPDIKILGVEDIIKYDWENHEITITKEASKRFEELNPPVNGWYFAVFLGEELIYDGYIWPLYSSLSYDGIVIEYPIISDNTLKIINGYPGEDFFKGDDLRNDQRIYDSLDQDGKIK